MLYEFMNTIGIVGGVGPYAGTDLFTKILDQTIARVDQEHLPILMFSIPSKIGDRTEYLIGKSSESPARFLSEIICKLHICGASVIGIPCNTAHADPIFKEILSLIPKNIKLLHLIEEVTSFIRITYPALKKIGILSTTGTFNTKLYPTYLEKNNLQAIQVTSEIQEKYIHPAIYHREYGIKANISIISTEAKNKINVGIDYLINNGAEAIILGCTEIPLIFTEKQIRGILLLNPSKILARALIMESNPTKLLK
jgi:aspartate racemase